MLKIDPRAIKKLRRLSLIIPYRHRFLNYKEFKRYYRLLEKHEKYSKEQIKQYQFKQLKQLVNIAYHQTNFYREKYEQAGFHPDMLTSLEDLKTIPLLTRDEVRKSGRQMIDRDNRKMTFTWRSSGTSGDALEIYHDKDAITRDWAATCYIWYRVGYQLGDGRVEFRVLTEPEKDFEFYPELRVLRINVIKMSEKNIDRILKKISSTGYRFFHGYPSAIYKMAKILEKKDNYFQPEAILFTSEMLYDWQIEEVQRIFLQSKCIDFYGMSEHACIAIGNPDRSYSFIPAYGIVEMDSEKRQIIATGLTNRVMPLIRYQLDDTVEGLEYEPQLNPNLFPRATRLTGKLGAYTYTNDGNSIPPTVFVYVFKYLNKIRSMKIIQHDYEQFELLLEGTDDAVCREESEKIKNALKNIYGEKSKFEINFVDTMPGEKSGKFKWIECRIKK